jgi:hypothetical protein
MGSEDILGSLLKVRYRYLYTSLRASDISCLCNTLGVKQKPKTWHVIIMHFFIMF